MRTIDTSPLTPATPREPGGVFAPGPLAGLATTATPTTLLSPAEAFIAQFEKIARRAQHDEESRRLASGDFFLLIDMLETIYLRSGHERLVATIRTVHALIDIDGKEARIASAITNILTQRL